MNTPIRSAGVVIVQWVQDEPHYLLLRVYGYWDFPKGEVDPGEEPLSTARREVREETTLDDLVFRWGHNFRETPLYGKGKIARYYVAQSESGEVALPVSPELGRAEHHEFRWLPYAQARKRLSERLKSILDWAHGVVTVANDR